MDIPPQTLMEFYVRRCQQLLLLNRDAHEIIAGLLAGQEQKPVDVGQTWPNGVKLLENFTRVERLLVALGDNPGVRARATLLKLLQVEQDQLEADQRQLEIAERWLAEWNARVAQLYVTSASCPSDGASPQKAAELLVTMHSVQGLLEGLCQRLRDALDRGAK